VSARTSSASDPLSKELVQAKLAQAWSRTIANQFKGNKTAFAGKIGVCPDTVSNALSGTMPEFHTILNSLLACPNALDEALSLYGLQLIPRDLVMTPDMQTLHKMSHALSEFINALRDGSAITGKRWCRKSFARRRRPDRNHPRRRLKAA
jgi:hypothetical protein